MYATEQATGQAAERVERARHVVIMLDLLYDAGADDLVRALSAEQAEHLYHQVVHAVARAAEDWRAALSQEATSEEVLRTGQP